MSGLRPQRTLFPNSGLGKPLSENVCFVVKLVSRGTVRKDRFENRAANLWVQYHTVSRPVILIVAEQRGLEPVLYKKSALFLSSGNKICASGNRVHALNWFYSANSRTELGMVRELKSRQSDGAAK
jgi:hypothetical protein